MFGGNTAAGEREKTHATCRGRKMVRENSTAGLENPVSAGDSGKLEGESAFGGTAHPGRSRSSPGAAASGFALRVRHHQDTLRSLLGARVDCQVSSTSVDLVRRIKKKLLSFLT